MGCEKLSYEARQEPSSFLTIWKKRGQAKTNLSFFCEPTEKNTAKKIFDNYYPFGLTFNEYQRTASTPQKYKYNGKELQDETGWLDYGARMYQPEIGRWFAIDPMSELTIDQTPYHYVSANPIAHTDPFGLYKVYINGEEVKGKDKRRIKRGFNKFLSNSKNENEGRPGDASNYAEGAIVTNEFGAYQRQGDQMVDVSFNPSISAHNQTYYTYTNYDLRIRSKISATDNVVWQQILKLEQQGIFVPLTAEGYADDIYNQFGDDIDPSFYIGAQYMQMTLDVMSGFDAAAGSSARRMYRKFRHSARQMAKVQKARRQKYETTFGGMGRAPKNRWNRFLRQHKGQFKGKDWMKQARESYYKWRLGK